MPYELFHDGWMKAILPVLLIVFRMTRRMIVHCPYMPELVGWELEELLKDHIVIVSRWRSL